MQFFANWLPDNATLIAQSFSVQNGFCLQYHWQVCLIASENTLQVAIKVIVLTSLTWPDRYFLRNGAYRLEIISAYSEKGSGPKLKPYSFCYVPRCRFIVVTFLELNVHCRSL